MKISRINCQFSTKKSKLKSWLNQHRNDHFVKESKRLNYRSRSAFKLLEINERFKLIDQQTKVLDLGCTPGGWSQVASQISENRVLAIDVLEMQELANVIFLKGDITENRMLVKIKELGMDDRTLIISDMAPNLSGTLSDSYEIAQLNMACLRYVDVCLKERGSLVMKSFNGENEKSMYEEVQMRFRQCYRWKGQASRVRSSEFYYVGVKHRK